MLIAGPTASGKSALALALAERLGGAIVNADSMQVYRDLRIITARPTPDEEARVPHRLYGHVDAAENYSVGRWCADAGAALERSRAERRRADPGRRHRALLQGADARALGGAADAAGDPRRGARAARGARARRRCTPSSPAAIPSGGAAAARRPACGSRRALEVLEATGRSLADWHRDGMPAVLDPKRTRRSVPAPERAELYRRIDARFDAMLAGGALDEVRALDAPAARPDAAGDEGPWRALAAPPSRRRDHRSRRRPKAARSTPAATPSGR